MRAFVAIKIPEDGSLSKPVMELSSTGDMKVYGPKGLHLTLCFIGDIGEEHTEDMTDAIREAVEGTGPFDISIRGMGSFPGRKGPRIAWIGAESGGILEGLAERIANNMDDKGVGHDLKKFVPHITIGRARDFNGSQSASDIISKYEDTEFFTYECDRIILYNSELRPEGAAYRILSEVSL